MAIIDVDASASDDKSQPYQKIQTAIKNADSDDTIDVAPGTYDESVTIDVEGLTLKGPNAGLAGDSNQRGAEATITDANGRSEISAANVTIDGFNFEFGEQAIRSGGGVDSLITNSRFELTADTSNGYAIRAEESSTGIDVTDNLFTGITSNDGTGGDNANGVVVRDPNGTRIAGNIFSSVDTAVNIGSKTDDTASGTVSVENNKFSGITQFGAVLVNNPDTSLDVDVNNNTIQSSEVGVFTFNANDGATFSIQDNDFQSFANDEVFVDDSAGVLTLDDVLNTQGNTFDPDGEVVGNQIRVEGTAPADTVVNLDSGQTFTGRSAVQDAVDAAGTGDTIRVGPGEFQGPVQVIEDQTNLTIRSAAGPENTVINATDGSARSTPSFNAQAVRISVDGVTIDGFNIVGDDTIVSGVFVAGGDGGGDNVRVVNNIIEGMSRPGFGGPSDNSAGIVTAAFGGGDPEVVDGFVARNNTIRDIGSNAKKPNNPGDGTRAQGISLIDIAGDTAGDGAVIENNTISSLAGQDTTTGIAVQPLDRPTENGNNLAPGVNVQDNDVSGADVGLFLGDSGGLNIANNEFSNNRVSVEDGSEAVDLNAVLQNNTFDRAVTVEDDSGNITGDSIFTTIQPTVDAASDGDTVSVSSGTYDEEVTIGKNITLTEADNNTSTPTISGQVRITGAVDSSEALEVSELDLEYDSNNAGSGKKSTILFKQNQYENVTLDSNTITAPSDGFAVYKQKSSGSSSPDDNITFENNTFKSGGSGADQLVVIEADSNNRPTFIDFESNVLTGTVNSGPALKHEGKKSIIGGSGNGNDFTGGSNSEVSRDNESVLVKTTGDSITIEENDFPTAGGLVISAEGDDTSIKNNSFDSISTDNPIIEATGKNTSISGNTADGDNLPAEGESEAGNDVQNVINQSGPNETVEIEQGGSSDNKETYTIDPNQSDEPNKNTVAVNASNVIIEGESDRDELQVPDSGPGIEITGSSTGVEIKDVGIESNGSDDTGIVVGGSGVADNCTIKGNSITVNPDAAVKIKNGSTNSVIEDNSLETAGGASGGAGVLIKDAGGGNLITLNDIDSEFANGVDIENPDSANASNVTVRFNNLRGNNAGIKNNDDENVDARSNFWGDKTGPSGDVDDPETGRTADGDGNAIDNGSNDGKVRYDEFLEISNDFILNTGSPSSGRDTDGDGLHEDFNNDGDHFPTDGYLFLRALRQGHFDRLADIDNPGGDLSTNYTTRFDFDGDGSDDISRSDVVSMVINRNRD